MFETAKISLTKPGKRKISKEWDQTAEISFRMVLSIPTAYSHFADKEFTDGKHPTYGNSVLYTDW